MTFTVHFSPAKITKSETTDECEFTENECSKIENEGTEHKKDQAKYSFIHKDTTQIYFETIIFSGTLIWNSIPEYRIPKATHTQLQCCIGSKYACDRRHPQSKLENVEHVQ